MEGFRIFTFGNTGPSISISKNGVTFNKAAIEKIGSPQKVLLYISDETKRIAVKKAAANDANAVPFLASNKNTPSVRWNNKELLRQIAAMTGWDLSAKGEKSYRVIAIHDKSENALIFDLTTAIEST